MRRTSFSTATLAAGAAALALLTVHCGVGGSQGADTGATCPPGSTLTYANFGKPFMDNYCVSCHSGKERPSLDSATAVKRELRGISSTSAAGPKATNDSMPTDGDVPQDDRVKLGEWLACGAP